MFSVSLAVPYPAFTLLEIAVALVLLAALLALIYWLVQLVRQQRAMSGSSSSGSGGGSGSGSGSSGPSYQQLLTDLVAAEQRVRASEEVSSSDCAELTRLVQELRDRGAPTTATESAMRALSEFCD